MRQALLYSRVLKDISYDAAFSSEVNLFVLAAFGLIVRGIAHPP